MDSRLPKIFYKYRSFRDKESKDSIPMLRNNELYFSSPLNFNDPFDCLASEDIFTNPKSFESFIQYCGVPENISKQITPSLMQDPQYLSFAKETLNKLDENIKKDTGILCLCEKNDSILMWSHYADSHKGFCIGFKNSLRFDSTNSPIQVDYLPKKTNDFLELWQIQQSCSQQDADEKILKICLCTKYIDWAYEQEWRLLSPVPGVKIYEDYQIASITFDMNMLSEKREVIRNILKNKKIDYFEALKSKQSFALDIIPI